MIGSRLTTRLSLLARSLLGATAVILLVALIDFLATGIWTIQQDEQGLLLRFGALERTLSPGIQFTLPYPLETVQVINTRETRKMPVGFRLVQGRDPTPVALDEREWLTGDTNVIDIKLMIHYVISDPALYLFRVGQGDADFLIRKSAESMLTATIANMRVDEVFTTGKIEIQEQTRRGTQALLDQIGAGIKVLSANLQEITPPGEVIEAFNDVSRAKADKDRSVQEADGYVKDRLPRARAAANKILQKALIYENNTLTEAGGRAERFTSLLTEYEHAKEITRTRLFLETLETVLARVEKIIVTTDDQGRAQVQIIR